jgi:hypothetical protein
LRNVQQVPQSLGGFNNGQDWNAAADACRQQANVVGAFCLR